jgi:23S rRNA (guanosine2251-2'-O)-methyltransferase
MSRTSDVADPGWVWGRHAVNELLRTNPGQVAQVFLATGDRTRPEVEELCRQNRIPLLILDSKRFPRRTGSVTQQSPAARLKSDYSYIPLEDLLEKTGAAPDPPAILLVLDHIQDPQNLGALVRTAYCAGVKGIIVPRDRSCPVSGTVRKAASGALEHLPICQITNLARTLDILKEKGFWILALDAAGPTDIYQIDFQVPLAVVIGSEGKGVSPLVLKKSDWVATIPMNGKLTSLNASAAAAVALFEIQRQRRAGKAGGSPDSAKKAPFS